MRAALWFLVCLCLPVALLLLGAGCVGGGSLELTAHASAPVIVPTGDPDAPPVYLLYSLSRPATVNVYLTDASGNTFYLRREEHRPRGDYRLPFDGAYVPEDSPEERRILANGRYTVTVEAVDSDGNRRQATDEIVVEGADAEAPRIENLVAYPSSISPNFDALDDVSQVSFRLTKEAELSIYATDASGNRAFLGEQERREPGEYVFTFSGIMNDKPLPDGAYQYTVVARDAVGNVTLARVPITVENGGLPEARITSVRFTPHQLMKGDLLHVAITVKNVGNTVLRTQGPPPGYTYTTYDNFTSIENHTLVDRPGLWRVGVDWAGAPTSSGARFPYRWGFGRDLQPGEEVTVEGAIQILNENQREMWFFAGLCQEGIRYHDEGVGRTLIQVGG